MRKKLIIWIIFIILPVAIVKTDDTIRRVRIPILMYHYVSEIPTDADSIRIGLTITPEVFKQHLEYLKSEGYSTISLYEMNKALKNGYKLPSKPIILTFDDGYVDHYKHVYPLLRDFNYVGTFFVITDFADQQNPNHLSWEQINEMVIGGMSMESHTKSHPTLVNRDQDFLVWEILGSLEAIESHTGIRPQFFSYPVGKYDQDTLKVVASTSILSAVTTEYGTYHTLHDAILSPRLRITENMGVNGLRHLLENAP